jgi:hypothetical protein
MFQTRPELAADIDALADRLSALSIGETVEYAELSRILGRRVTDDGYALGKARKRVEKDLGCLLETVRGVGVKRLAPAESIKVGSQIMGHIRRTARKGIERMENISANNLDQQESAKLIAYRSQLGAIAFTADKKHTDAIAKAEPTRVLPIGKVIEAIGGQK